MSKPITFCGVRNYLFADTSSFKSAHHLPRIFFFVALLLFHDLHCPLSRQQRVSSAFSGLSGTSNNGLYGEAPPKRLPFFRLQVERVGIFLVEVYLAEVLKTYLKMGQNIRTETWR